MTAIKFLRAEDTWPLRHRVLRPHMPIASVSYAEDAFASALHIGATDGDQIVGVVSIYNEDEKGGLGSLAWRLRGMATAPEIRGTGIGGIILLACIDEVRNHGGSYLWCNARTSASGFYQRYGFVIASDLFEIPNIGPHYVMKFNL